jgi:hypothetical protein
MFIVSNIPSEVWARTTPFTPAPGLTSPDLRLMRLPTASTKTLLLPQISTDCTALVMPVYSREMIATAPDMEYREITVRLWGEWRR